MAIPQTVRLLIESEAPPGAFLFNEKTAFLALSKWRREVTRCLSKRNGRAIAVAWSLQWLMRKRNYAFCTNKYIANDNSMSLDAVERGLKELADCGLIVRVQIDGRRRIYPAMPTDMLCDPARVEHGVETLDNRGSAPAKETGLVPAFKTDHKSKHKGATSVAPPNEDTEEALPDFLREDFDEMFDRDQTIPIDDGDMPPF